MEYRYHLLKYSGKASRLTCPQCGRQRCFTPYVDADDNIIGPEYGRCDHESSCGYVKYPPSDYSPFKESYRTISKKPKPRRFKPMLEDSVDVCTIPMDTVMKTVRTDPPSGFLTFLLSILDADTVYCAASEYSLGVTKARDVIFYQIDIKGRCRTGKVMKYDPVTGHRIKDDGTGTPITWVHTLLKRNGALAQGWELTQCLFGEHLLARYPDKPVALVESEKTAVVCACINPDCVWLATGGKGQLNDRVEVLAGRKVIAFPDVDGYDTWVQKASERPHLGIIVSDLLEKNATPEDRAAHIDIADLLIKSIQEQPLPCPPDSDNPVFLEVRKYISPEYHAEVLALIEELGLELVGVTKMHTGNLI
jgi:hypothetical protein